LTHAEHDNAISQARGSRRKASNPRVVPPSICGVGLPWQWLPVRNTPWPSSSSVTPRFLRGVCKSKFCTSSLLSPLRRP